MSYSGGRSPFGGGGGGDLMAGKHPWQCPHNRQSISHTTTPSAFLSRHVSSLTGVRSELAGKLKKRQGGDDAQEESAAPPPPPQVKLRASESTLTMFHTLSDPIY